MAIQVKQPSCISTVGKDCIEILGRSATTLGVLAALDLSTGLLGGSCFLIFKKAASSLVALATSSAAAYTICQRFLRKQSRWIQTCAIIGAVIGTALSVVYLINSIAIHYFSLLSYRIALYVGGFSFLTNGSLSYLFKKSLPLPEKFSSSIPIEEASSLPVILDKTSSFEIKQKERLLKKAKLLFSYFPSKKTLIKVGIVAAAGFAIGRAFYLSRQGNSENNDSLLANKPLLGSLGLESNNIKKGEEFTLNSFENSSISRFSSKKLSELNKNKKSSLESSILQSEHLSTNSEEPSSSSLINAVKKTADLLNFSSFFLKPFPQSKTNASSIDVCFLQDKPSTGKTSFSDPLFSESSNSNNDLKLGVNEESTNLFVVFSSISISFLAFCVFVHHLQKKKYNNMGSAPLTQKNSLQTFSSTTKRDSEDKITTASDNDNKLKEDADSKYKDLDDFESKENKFKKDSFYNSQKGEKNSATPADQQNQTGSLSGNTPSDTNNPSDLSFQHQSKSKSGTPSTSFADSLDNSLNSNVINLLTLASAEASTTSGSATNIVSTDTEGSVPASAQTPTTSGSMTNIVSTDTEGSVPASAEASTTSGSMTNILSTGTEESVPVSPETSTTSGSTTNVVSMVAEESVPVSPEASTTSGSTTNIVFTGTEGSVRVSPEASTTSGSRNKKEGGNSLLGRLFKKNMGIRTLSKGSISSDISTTSSSDGTGFFESIEEVTIDNLQNELNRFFGENENTEEKELISKLKTLSKKIEKLSKNTKEQTLPINRFFDAAKKVSEDWVSNILKMILAQNVYRTNRAFMKKGSIHIDMESKVTEAQKKMLQFILKKKSNFPKQLRPKTQLMIEFAEHVEGVDLQRRLEEKASSLKQEIIFV